MCVSHALTLSWWKGVLRTDTLSLGSTSESSDTLGSARRVSCLVGVGDRGRGCPAVRPSAGAQERRRAAVCGCFPQRAVPNGTSRSHQPAFLYYFCLRQDNRTERALPRVVSRSVQQNIASVSYVLRPTKRQPTWHWPCTSTYRDVLRYPSDGLRLTALLASALYILKSLRDCSRSRRAVHRSHLFLGLRPPTARTSSGRQCGKACSLRLRQST